MLFFELNDIEKMLDNTHDPMADFINAAASDVVAFCATLTYEEFLEKTELLNSLVRKCYRASPNQNLSLHFSCNVIRASILSFFLQATFKQLCARAEIIGYQINKVVFRGFHSSDALQAMHDKAIQERTRYNISFVVQ